MIVEATFTWREYVPLFYVPIPNRHNPVGIVPTYNKVTISVSASSSGFIVVNNNLDRDIVNLIKLFLSLLQSEVGNLPGLKIEVVAEGCNGDEINSTYLYVAVTNALTYFLCGEVSSDITESVKVLDMTMGVDDSVLALREFVNVREGHAYIWRLNEGYITSNKQVILKLKKINSFLMNYMEHESADLITHVAGVATIGAFEKLLKNEPLISELRTLNAVWHMLYGVPLPYGAGSNYYVLIKEIGGCSLHEVKEITVQ